jgi:hypothetical protein
MEKQYFFCCAANLHHTQNVLNEEYVPTTEMDIDGFNKMQEFMHVRKITRGTLLFFSL